MAGRGLNKVQIIGNLGAEPEMKYSGNGKPFTTFRVAVGRVSRTPEGENREETEWFRVIAWDKLAETCNQYLRKGSKVYIEGRLQSRTYKDNNGVDQKVVEIIANEMLMLDSRPDHEGAPGGQERNWDQGGARAGQGGRRPPAGIFEEDDEPPF